jgi:hypothetical protein
MRLEKVREAENLNLLIEFVVMIILKSLILYLLRLKSKYEDQFVQPRKGDISFGPEILDKAKSWAHRNWISAKKWWYKKVVLQEQEWPQFEDLSEKNSSKTNTVGEPYGDPLEDFEYSYPLPDTYAYIW